MTIEINSGERRAAKIDDLKRGHTRVATLLGSFVKRQNSKSTEVEETKNESLLVGELRDRATQILNENRGSIIALYEKTITDCILSVYEDEDFEFKLAEKNLSKKIGYEPAIKQDDDFFHPEDEMGNGVCNLIGFIARVVSVFLSGVDKIILMDEPFTNLGDYIYRVNPILEALAKQFGIQFIIITNDVRLMDKSFNHIIVEKIGGISMIKSKEQL